MINVLFMFFVPFFSWLDGTPVTYTAWEHNEPNFANNDENCVTMYKSMGESNAVSIILCGLTNNSFLLFIHCSL